MENVRSAGTIGPALLFGRVLFCFLNNSDVLRILTTLYLAKNDHRWVTFIALKTITENAGNYHYCRARTSGPESEPRRETTCR